MVWELGERQRAQAKVGHDFGAARAADGAEEFDLSIAIQSGRIWIGRSSFTYVPS